MRMNTVSSCRVAVTEVEEFLRNPPDGFSVEALGSGYRVHSDPEKSLVFIDAIDSSRGKIVFQNSLGRKFKMHNLWEYTSMRKSLLSKRIYLLGSVCEDKIIKRKEVSASKEKTDKQARVLQQYVLSIDGNNPFIKWQMEKGLDWTIASVAGESYRVDIDLSELLEGWPAENIVTEKPVWRDASFTLKYYSDALFDFPHQFGFSKRTFKLRPI